MAQAVHIAQSILATGIVAAIGACTALPHSQNTPPPGIAKTSTDPLTLDLLLPDGYRLDTRPEYHLFTYQSCPVARVVRSLQVILFDRDLNGELGLGVSWNEATGRFSVRHGNSIYPNDHLHYPPVFCKDHDLMHNDAVAKITQSIVDKLLSILGNIPLHNEDEQRIALRIHDLLKRLSQRRPETVGRFGGSSGGNSGPTPLHILVPRRGDLWELTCAATLLNETSPSHSAMVATAAHCIPGNEPQLYVGSGEMAPGNGQQIDLAVVHRNKPRPNRSTLMELQVPAANNIALLFLKNSLGHSNVAWPKPPMPPQATPEGPLTGFGYGSPKTGTPHFWRADSLQTTRENTWHALGQGFNLARGDEGGGVADGHTLWGILGGRGPGYDAPTHQPAPRAALIPTAPHGKFFQCAQRTARRLANTHGHSTSLTSTLQERNQCPRPSGTKQSQALPPLAERSQTIAVGEHATAVVLPWASALCRSNLGIHPIANRRIMLEDPNGRTLHFLITAQTKTTATTDGGSVANHEDHFLGYLPAPDQPVVPPCPSTRGSCKDKPASVDCVCSLPTLQQAAVSTWSLMIQHLGDAGSNDVANFEAFLSVIEEP